jgi:CHASE3 domain sensor protein
MNTSKNWKLRHWIIGGYAIPIAALIVSAIVTVLSVQRVTEEANELKVANNINDRIGKVDTNLQIMSRTTLGYLLEQDPVSIESYQVAEAKYEDLITELQSLITDEQQIDTLQQLEVEADALRRINQSLIDMVDQGQTEAAIARWRNDDGWQQAETLTALMEEMEQREHQILDHAREQQDESLSGLQFIVLASAGSSAVFSVIVGAWIINRTTNRINESASTIASSSAEIAASIDQQERTALQQASSVSETTTTMEELGASSRQTAEQVEAATTGAQQALTLAEDGTSAVERSLDGMERLREKVGAIADQILRLSEQTGQIGSISGLVSDLANQTNMLALNAAVEAVRAGEHGKGFAVVSSEIRKLADQSKKSAEKINGLVTDIQSAINSTVMATDEGTKTVEEGVHIAEETSQAFSGVTDAMNNVVLNSQQISLNVQQQAIAVEQVVGAMNSLNRATQETASGISQIKIGTQRLSDASVVLKDMV